jgi:hypothetical protein
MVCSRCKTTVKTELDKPGIRYVSVESGEVTIKKKLTSMQHHLLFLILQQFGFELIDNDKNYPIEKLKMAIFDLEIYSDEDLKTSYPDFVSLRVMVKELLEHNNLNISEITVKMHYSNMAQLSSEFKSITGLTPLHFRQLKHISCNNLSIN